MNDLRTGALIRAARRHRRLRQSDVAAAIGISQTTVSLVERGHFDVLSVGVVRRVASYVEVDLPFAPRFRGSEGDRLLDARHAALVDAVVALLRELGWQVEVEHSYNHYGDRGSVDVLAWRDDCRALLIVEVKTELVDVQQLCRSLDVKRRVVPPLVARERGWKPASLGCILVLPDERARRAAVARHAAVFDVAFDSGRLSSSDGSSGPRDGFAASSFCRLRMGPLVCRNPCRRSGSAAREASNNGLGEASGGVSAVAPDVFEARATSSGATSKRVAGLGRACEAARRRISA